MGENDDEKYSQAGQIFENFVQASTCKGTIQAFNILTRQLELDPLDNRSFYTKLKSRVTTWKAKALWNKLDKRASHKEYKRGKSCMNTKVILSDEVEQVQSRAAGVVRALENVTDRRGFNTFT